MTKAFALTLALGFSLATFARSEDAMRQEDAHEHGAGHAEIVVQDGQLLAEFHLTGADVLGFGRPTTPEQEEQADAAKTLLMQPGSVLILPEAANCNVATASVDLESEDDSNHSEFHVVIEAACGAPDALTHLDFSLFKTLQALHDLDVDYVIGDDASEAKLSPEQTRLKLR